jgi:hypothetical protein
MHISILFARSETVRNDYDTPLAACAWSILLSCGPEPFVIQCLKSLSGEPASRATRLREALRVVVLDPRAPRERASRAIDLRHIWTPLPLPLSTHPPTVLPLIRTTLQRAHTFSDLLELVVRTAEGVPPPPAKFLRQCVSRHPSIRDSLAFTAAVSDWAKASGLGR